MNLLVNQARLGLNHFFGPIVIVHIIGKIPQEERTSHSKANGEEGSKYELSSHPGCLGGNTEGAHAP